MKKWMILSVLSGCIFLTGNLAQAENFAKTSQQQVPGANVETAAEDVQMKVLAAQATANPNSQDAAQQAQADEDVLAQQVMAEAASKYTLGKTDVVEVSVQRHPEVSGQYIINSEGKIQYEFLGDVAIEGQTKGEVATKLTGLLATYIVNPEVTVKIVGYNSKVVYVIGEVGRPGKINMYGDTMTVREALLQAGLPLLSASTKNGKLFTPSSSEKPKQTKVDINALLYEGDLRQDLVMKPGDTLFVPPTGLTKIMRAIAPIAAPIGTAAGTGRTVMTGF